MREVKFVGSEQVSERVIRAKDFADNGVEDQNQVVFNRRNRFTAEVSDAAAELLVDTGEFEETERSIKAAEESKATSTANENKTNESKANEGKGGKK